MSPLEKREGRSLWVMRGRVSGLCACTCVSCVCVRGEGVGVRDWMRGGSLERHGGSMSRVKHGNMDTELL